MPVVVGPKNKLYMTDHHHQCRAMLDAKINPKHKARSPLFPYPFFY